MWGNGHILCDKKEDIGFGNKTFDFYLGFGFGFGDYEMVVRIL